MAIELPTPGGTSSDMNVNDGCRVPAPAPDITLKLEGIHHITAITADAPRNVEFYVGTLGLRLVKKSVNQDDPTVYHLFYGDDEGSPGADLTFFEYPASSPGRPGAGAVHRIVWRVDSPAAIDFWESRLHDEGVRVVRTGDEALRFADFEGLDHELTVYRGDERPLTADAPDIPADMALQGFAGVRAFTADPPASRHVLGTTLGFSGAETDEWIVAGDRRSSFYAYDPAPEGANLQGAGSVHHVAFATQPGEQRDWLKRVSTAPVRPTPIIDRLYFESIYFREPSGVLFELATIGPGFTVDEPIAELGRHLSVTPKFEHLRARLEETLVPLPDPRAERAARIRAR